MSIDIVRAIAKEGKDLALVTIVAVKGSVPRHPGSKMLVRRTKDILGTVGGGRGEVRAIEAGRRCIESRASASLTVEMLGAEAVGKDMICGGVSSMIVEYVDDPSPYAAALPLLEAGERVLFAKSLKGGLGDGAMTVSVAAIDERGSPIGRGGGTFDASLAAKALSGGKPILAEEEGVFYDPVSPEEKLLILGGGHVGLAVARFAAALEFKVTVADSRPEFLAPGRFPEGVATALGGYADAIEAFPFDSATYAVVVTPGHNFDLECVRALLSRKYRYAGVIGSARKTMLLLEQAKREGFDPARVDALCAPIGIDIGAETPEEIAISILAEVVAVRRDAKMLQDVIEGRAGRRG
jgi:xanthine dehydrogenase accessory factor